jgi:cell division protein ZapA
MNSDKNVLKVTIYGAEYTIRGQADPNYIKAVADYLDKKMREIDKNVRVDSSLKVAILASMHITDELFRERAEADHHRSFRADWDDRIKALIGSIDRNLGQNTK